MKLCEAGLWTMLSLAIAIGAYGTIQEHKETVHFKRAACVIVRYQRDATAGILVERQGMPYVVYLNSEERDALGIMKQGDPLCIKYELLKTVPK